MIKHGSVNGATLVDLARAAIGENFDIELSVDAEQSWLQQQAATFVTLMLNNQLRGCIGSLQAHRSLQLDVYENARGAAFRDPRFTALSKSEFEQVMIEVSLLTPPMPLEFRDEGDALRQLKPGTDGVIFIFDKHRSTFLPQVWEQLPEPASFLRQLKAKAGLPADFWHANIKLQRYTVQKWRELDERIGASTE